MTTAFPRDRYPFPALAAAFDSAPVIVDGENCLVTLDLGVEYEIELFYPLAGGEEARARARAVLAEINALDNLVQESCEREWARTGLARENFELALAYMELASETLNLGYFGSKVNTEWEAEFTLKDGRWEKANF